MKKQRRKQLLMNEEVEAETVRLITEDGEQVGIVPTSDALERARKDELDLVEISPTADPPVCRIMDYGKYKYQQQKKQHDQKKKHHGAEMKQLRLKSFRIDPHDLEIKLRKAREIIEEGNRLLVTLMFRAREHSHADLGEELMREKFAGALQDVSRVETPPRKDGRRMTMLLAPVPNLKKVLHQREKERQAAEKAAEKAAAQEAEKADGDDGDTNESGGNGDA